MRALETDKAISARVFAAFFFIFSSRRICTIVVAIRGRGL